MASREVCKWAAALRSSSTILTATRAPRHLPVVMCGVDCGVDQDGHSALFHAAPRHTCFCTRSHTHCTHSQKNNDVATRQSQRTFVHASIPPSPQQWSHCQTLCWLKSPQAPQHGPHHRDLAAVTCTGGLCRPCAAQLCSIHMPQLSAPCVAACHAEGERQHGSQQHGPYRDCPHPCADRHRVVLKGVCASVVDGDDCGGGPSEMSHQLCGLQSEQQLLASSFWGQS